MLIIIFMCLFPTSLYSFQTVSPAGVSNNASYMQNLMDSLMDSPHMRSDLPESIRRPHNVAQKDTSDSPVAQKPQKQGVNLDPKQLDGQVIKSGHTASQPKDYSGPLNRERNHKCVISLFAMGKRILESIYLFVECRLLKRTWRSLK